MDEPQISVQAASIGQHSFWASHRFLILVGASIVISLILVVISMDIYDQSGAAQLDLSRPGYRGVSSQAVTSDNTFPVYADSGPVNQASIDQFKALLSAEQQNINTIDAFGGDPLNPNALEINAPTN